MMFDLEFIWQGNSLRDWSTALGLALSIELPEPGSYRSMSVMGKPVLLVPIRRAGGASLYGNIEVRSGKTVVGKVRGLGVYPEIGERMAEGRADVAQALRLDPAPLKSDLASHLHMLGELKQRAHAFDVLHFHVDLLHFVTGQVLAVETADLWVIGGVTCLVVVGVILAIGVWLTRPIERLAAADAFRSLGLDRRQALWDARSLIAAPDLPLFAAMQARDEGDEARATRLPAMPLSEEVVADYQTLRLSLKAHPLAFLRPRLAERGFVREVMKRIDWWEKKRRELQD